MNRTIRNILLSRCRTLVVSADVEATPIVTASTIMQLAQLGYRTDALLLNDSLTKNLAEDFKVLEQMRGGGVKYVPLFTGFPDSVPEKNEFLMRRIIGFFGNYFGAFDQHNTTVLDDGMVVPEWLFDLDQFGGDPILGRQDLGLFEKGAADQEARKDDGNVEWIDLSVMNEESAIERLKVWLTGCLYSKSSIKEVLKPDIEAALEYFGADVIDSKKVVFKETKSYLSKFFWNKGDYVAAANCLDTPTDVLRLMAALTNSDVSLAKPIKFPKLSRPARRAVMSVLERSKNPSEDMNKYKELWLDIGKGLHPTAYLSQFPKTAIAFDILRNSKVVTFEGCVEEAIKNKNVSEAVRLLEERPASFARRLHHVLELAHDVKSNMSWLTTLTRFETVAHKVPIKNLLTLQSYIKTIDDSEYFSILNKKGHLRVQKSKRLNRISDACRSSLDNVLSSAITRQMEDKESWSGKRVYINDVIRNYVVPLSQRKASDGLLTIERGTRIDIDASKTVRLFIYWKQKETRTDLDLSCISFDKDMRYLGQVSYTNLQNGNITHSGDTTSAPFGASEFIDICPAKVKKDNPAVRYIAAQVYCFTGESFVNLEECYSGWMIRDAPDKSQKSFDIKTVQNKFNVRGSGKYIIPCLLDLETNQIVYTDLYMKGINNANRVEGAVHDVSIITYEVARMLQTKPNMYDLAVYNALGRNATLVSSPDEADITFDVSNSTYDVTNVERILSELV